MVEDKFLKKLKNIKVKISEEDVLERIIDRLRWPKKYPSGQPTIEVILENGNKHSDFFLEDEYLDSQKCLDAYDQGYTLILSNIAFLFKDTTVIQNELSINFGKNINCNFYFGNGKKSVSFNKHQHEYPVIVKNIYGNSKWIIDEKEVILKDQDVIWFDKNIDHQVVSINKPKLSMTCNIS